MAKASESNLIVRGIACAVPSERQTEVNLAASFGEVDAKRLVKGTGVAERRIGTKCTSDLCFEAANRLINDLGWARDSISHLILVTQSADYVLPATACLLQDRLGLSTECTAFDVNLGCSGYTYGLWLISRLLRQGQRAVLLVGDTISMPLKDRATVPLFGHAGTATAIERPVDGSGGKAVFCLGTDGSGARNIIIEAGHFRIPSTPETRECKATPDGNVRSQEDVYMNGSEVFTFALKGVPPLVNECLQAADWTLEQCDDIVFHQANGFMLKTLGDKLGIPSEKVPTSLRWFGNTSSASIPLTLVTERRDQLQTSSRRYLLVGFGVGWSWGAAAIELGPMIIPPLIEL